MLVARTQWKKGQCHYHGHTVGDQVWLEGTNLKLMHPKAKLDAKRYGPFTITEEISLVVYHVELPQQWKIHNIFHASLLMPYKETEEHGENYMQLPPELVEGKEEYEVEQVLNSRCTGCTKKLQYLLWWKGYSRAHDSWQDTTEVHTPKLVADYLARKPSAIRTTMLKGHAGDQGNPIFMNSLHTPYGEDVLWPAVGSCDFGPKQAGARNERTSKMTCYSTSNKLRGAPTFKGAQDKMIRR
jgi:Chromo (CHRromatin Organisation MOdifier) domain